MNETPVIEARGVGFTYTGNWLQKITALHDVTVSVPTGSIFGYLGANGAGKSTLIKLMMGLLRGHSGQIRLFGEDIGNPKQRTHLGYLPEQPFFYENLQVHEYLSYLGHLSGLDSATLKRNAERVYELLDLGDLRKRKLGSFSKGMRQRFGLAQTIIHEPKLIVLDEPFSGLDPLWRARFRQIFTEENKRGATLFFSSHILSDIEDLCTHYAVIDHGRVLEQNRLDALFEQAPLQLIGTGPMPKEATRASDNSWTWVFNDDQRQASLDAVHACGGSILRLERQKLGLEEYFVQRVAEHHAAGPATKEGGSI